MVTLQTLAPRTVVELAQEANHIILYSVANKIKPMAAIVVTRVDGEWTGAFLCIYAMQTEVDPRGSQSMPLTPFFYPYEVASFLVARGILIEEHESMKTGIQTHWCRVVGDLSL